MNKISISLVTALTILTVGFVGATEPDNTRTSNDEALNPVCLLDSVTGHCRARIIRWYYNKAAGECQEFTYGGCGGNGNKFGSRRQCENKCRRGGSVAAVTGCPQRPCSKNCPHGFIVDAQGCTRCACKADPNAASCPEIECPDRCANGYQKDERGCQTCRCKRRPH